MAFDPELAAIRYGYGLSPDHRPSVSVDGMVAALAAPDLVAGQIPIPGFAALEPTILERSALGRAERDARGTAGEMAARERLQAWQRAARQQRMAGALATIARGVAAPDALRERLVAFWADHFTVTARNGQSIHLVTAYVEGAIRPHVTGRFSDMLKAVVQHPMMLSYLQQAQSIGPNSTVGQRRERGLNENLARELIELHTLGVGGAYTQDDVTQLAELLTGLTYRPQDGFQFRPRVAEPGAEVVLGRRYGPEARLGTILQAMEDIAAHPDTAEHLARKLAVHFLSDTPDEGLVSAVADAFRRSDGDLLQVTAALLQHPAAWQAERVKVKTPVEFMIASARALGVDPAGILQADGRFYRDWIEGALRIMGQPWEQAPGPDGWPERAAEWITPQGMAGRISWALKAPSEFMETLPDPRDFVQTALGSLASAEVAFAAAAAETRADGVGVVLASPAFQRR